MEGKNFSKYDGGQAFACASENGHDSGMSIRDYFAAQALAGLVSDPSYEPSPYEESVATQSYALADAMLQERSK